MTLNIADFIVSNKTFPFRGRWRESIGNEGYEQCGFYSKLASNLQIFYIENLK